MLKVKAALYCLGRHRLKTPFTVTRECLKKQHSTGNNAPWYSKHRIVISCVVIGGGIAFGVGLAASVLYHAPQVTLIAGCKEKKKHKKRDNIDEGYLKDASGGALRVADAVNKTRELLERTKDEVGSPGIVAAVSVNGKLLWAEGFGYADVENRLPCTSDSVHRIASISKSFTITAVGKLWEEGKLDLDKPIQHYVPEFPEKEVDGQKVTITTRQLVSHLAGIRHYSKDYIQKLENQSKDASPKNEHVTKKNTGDVNKEDDATQKEFYTNKEYSSVIDCLEIFKDDPLVHKPGRKFLYTTHGWTLVSAIVDGAADEDFVDYMKRIFNDLGMPHTVPDKAQPIIYNRARGYARNKKGRLVNTPAVNLSSKWAGGGYLSDVRDLIQFGNAMLYSHQHTDRHRDAGMPLGYLKPETMRTIWSPVANTKCAWDKDGFYAMGWAVRDKSDHKGFCPEKHHMVSHTGGAVGASSVLLVVNGDETQNLDNNSSGQPKASPKDSIDDRKDRSKGKLHVNNTASSKDCLSLPQGIVVAVVANLTNVNLYRTAVEIAELFQRVDR